MDKKKFLLLGFIVLILTGCARLTDNYDDIVTNTMNNKNNTVNTVSTGYELYIPLGVTQVSDNEYNQKLKIKDRYIYLYVDTISYYYKNSLNNKKENNYDYYYKEINNNNKTGYIGIEKQDNDMYFCNIVYNYSKIEFYSNLTDLKVLLANSLIIQNSIKFNDNLIKMNLEGNSSDSKEIKYQLDRPKDSESTFSKVLQEYVADEKDDVVLPDDD